MSGPRAIAVESTQSVGGEVGGDEPGIETPERQRLAAFRGDGATIS
jgi:hypothetical protein